ncbi:hypothetical protein HBI04_162420 [Parastagonospora nodorum]|nr:hypothetical protein HBI03_167690 [Parastagonospora nodorum]KAH4268754.1 hypothetical protein HBI04_162420 [Parastagonospora nodorum]
MLIVTPIKNNDNLLNTINLHIKLRKLKEKYLKVCEADALKQVGANVRERENKNYSSLYYSDNSLLDSNDYYLDSSLDINLKNNLENEEAIIAKDLAREQKERLKALLNAKIRDSLSARNKRTIKLLARAYILYFKELLSNNSRIFASIIGITRTQAIVLLAIIGYKNKVVAIDSINSILCDLSNLLVIRFCIFSNPALENIGILTNKEVVEMQTNTATALANKLAAINKLIIAEANMPAMHSKAIKHYLALLAAQFTLVCSFRKIDKHVFRAYNTISIIVQRTIIRKGSPYIEKRRRTIFNKFYNCKLEGIIIAKFY